MMIASITQTTPLQGFVSSDLQVAVQCQRIEGQWEPLFGIKRGVGKIQLPSCFVLSDAAIGALDMAAEEHLNYNKE